MTPPADSIRLELLGPVRLNRPGREEPQEIASVLRQPKRFALFVYLTLNRPREFCQRGSLLPVFWPEASEERARTALRQTLHYLRSCLGERVFESRGRSEIRVDPYRVTCDVLDFQECLATGRSAEALDLYRGTLLEGLHVDGSVNFQEWLSLERERMERLASEGAWDRSCRLEDEGLLDEARKWARRSVELAPYRERAVRRYIALLDRMGERGAALREFQRLEERLRRELDVAPSPETADLVERVRERRESRWTFPLFPHVDPTPDG